VAGKGKETIRYKLKEAAVSQFISTQIILVTNIKLIFCYGVLQKAYEKEEKEIEEKNKEEKHKKEAKHKNAGNQDEKSSDSD